MIKIVQAEPFRQWLINLRDRRARRTIFERVNRLRRDLVGDIVYLGEGVFEMPIHFGPGYRIYFLRTGDEIVILLCGGDKGSQKRDIDSARSLAKSWRQYSV